MSTVHSVSDITNILSGIIQDQSTLQGVWIRGKILEIFPPNGLTLGDGKCSIDCRNGSKKVGLFASLKPGKQVYYACGKVIVSPQESKYRFAVTEIQPNQSSSLSKNARDLTANLQTTIKQLEIVQVQGKISFIDQKGGFTLLRLKDANFNKWTDGEMIECAIPPGINPKIALNLNDDVCVRGQIDIFQKASQYQIIIANADDMMPGFSLKRCKCPGCKSCQRSRDNIQCDQSRKAQHELCSPCYAISPDNEKRVEEAVETYFSNLKVKEFSPKTQHGIQIGSENRIADVVLADQNGSFAAIAECKGAGYVGHGIEQLKSYLCATDTRFGIFANRTNPEQWEFYENRRRNRFDQIDRPEFEAGVVEQIATRERLKDEIKALEKAKDDLGDKKSELATEIAQLMQTERDLQDAHKQLISEIGKKRVQQGELETEIGKLAKTEYDLQDTHKQLRKEIEATTQQHADLKQEITELRNQKLELKTEIGKLQQKEHKLHASREQRNERIQQFETLLNDLKSDLLDLEPPPLPEDNAGPQKSRENKKQGIKSWFKNPFSKENK